LSNRCNVTKSEPPSTRVAAFRQQGLGRGWSGVKYLAVLATHIARRTPTFSVGPAGSGERFPQREHGMCLFTSTRHEGKKHGQGGQGREGQDGRKRPNSPVTTAEGTTVRLKGGLFITARELADRGAQRVLNTVDRYLRGLGRARGGRVCFNPRY